MKKYISKTYVKNIKRKKKSDKNNKKDCEYKIFFFLLIIRFCYKNKVSFTLFHF